MHCFVRPLLYQFKRLPMLFIWKFWIRFYHFFRYKCVLRKPLWSVRSTVYLCIDSSRSSCSSTDKNSVDRTNIHRYVSSPLLISEFTRTLLEHFIKQTECPPALAVAAIDGSTGDSGALYKIGQSVARKYIEHKRNDMLYYRSRIQRFLNSTNRSCHWTWSQSHSCVQS
jgi:hypothetical protein